MPEVQEVFRMATQKVRPDQGFLERQERVQRRRLRNRKLGAMTGGALVVLVAIGLIVTLSRGGTTTMPANPSQPLNPLVQQAERTASDFVEAFGAFDAERAMRVVGPNPLSQVIDGQVPPTTEGLSTMLAMLRAAGYRQSDVSCQGIGSADTIYVSCPFDFDAIGSDEIGTGPFTGSTFTFTIRFGRIQDASWHLQTEDGFSAEMWKPFRDWVRRTHPKDLDVMYIRGGTDFRLTTPSIRLWEQRTKEYVEAVQRGAA